VADFSSTLFLIAGFVGSCQRRCYVFTSGVGYVGGFRVMACFLVDIDAQSAHPKGSLSLPVSVARVLLLFCCTVFSSTPVLPLSIANRGSPCAWRCLVPVLFHMWRPLWTIAYSDYVTASSVSDLTCQLWQS
jgi:hypothetical protein